VNWIDYKKIKKIRYKIKYKIKNYKAVTVWSVMTIVYILEIATLGGGGR